jgi:hypothetical protein
MVYFWALAKQDISAFPRGRWKPEHFHATIHQPGRAGYLYLEGFMLTALAFYVSVSNLCHFLLPAPIQATPPPNRSCAKPLFGLVRHGVQAGLLLPRFLLDHQADVPRSCNTVQVSYSIIDNATTASDGFLAEGPNPKNHRR